MINTYIKISIVYHYGNHKKNLSYVIMEQDKLTWSASIVALEFTFNTGDWNQSSIKSQFNTGDRIPIK